MALASSHHLNSQQKQDVYFMELERKAIERENESKHLLNPLKKTDSMLSLT